MVLSTSSDCRTCNGLTAFVNHLKGVLVQVHDLPSGASKLGSTRRWTHYCSGNVRGSKLLHFTWKTEASS